MMKELQELNLVKVEMVGAVAKVTICRENKRNALSDELVAELQWCFDNLPPKRAPPC